MDPQQRIVLGRVEKFRDRPRARSLIHRVALESVAGIKVQGVYIIYSLLVIVALLDQREQRDSAADRSDVRR